MYWGRHTDTYMWSGNGYGETIHSKHYNNYPNVFEQIRTVLKNARTKIKTLRLREKEIDEEKRVLGKLSEEEKVM